MIRKDITGFRPIPYISGNKPPKPTKKPTQKPPLKPTSTSISSSTLPYQKGLVRALLVGINYTGTQYELSGCINDVNNMQVQLQSYFPSCQNYRMLTDNSTIKPTRANILASIDWLVNGLQPGQNVFFHYSGHGGQLRDTNGDEVSGLDSCIYPLNGRQIETLTDDELRSLLAIKIPAGCKCFVVLDSCHSGSAVDLRYLYQAPSFGTMIYTENQTYSKTLGDILFMSGCRDNQTSADTVDMNNKPSGALTMSLLATWKTYGPAIKLKYVLWDVRKFLKDYGYTQIPQLSSGNYLDMNGFFDLGN